MKLWVNGKNGSAGSAIQAVIKKQVLDIDKKVISRGVRVVNAVRNAELEVLKGQRTGKVYRKPFSKYATYTASAPGESPARRTGNLRMHWNGQVKTESISGERVAIMAVLESQEPYAILLENGTHKMAPRPLVDKIKEKAAPEIRRIYSEPYT